MSGLTVGLTSIDKIALELASKSDPLAKKSMERIFPVIKRHHWMLVTLLVCNAAAIETLPLALDELFPYWLSMTLSVVFCLFFAEIIPQAVCTGPS